MNHVAGGAPARRHAAGTMTWRPRLRLTRRPWWQSPQGAWSSPGRDRRTSPARSSRMNEYRPGPGGRRRSEQADGSACPTFRLQEPSLNDRFRKQNGAVAAHQVACATHAADPRAARTDPRLDAPSWTAWSGPEQVGLGGCLPTLQRFSCSPHTSTMNTRPRALYALGKLITPHLGENQGVCRGVTGLCPTAPPW